MPCQVDLQRCHRHIPVDDGIEVGAFARIVAGSPEDLGRVVREDQAKWARIIRAKNITIE